MVRSASVLRFAVLGAALGSLAGCGGRALWLGKLAASADGGGAETGAEVAVGDVSPDSVATDGIPGDASPDGGSTCPPGQVSANQVLWIGDSWMLVPSRLDTRVRDLARAAGVLGPSDDYTFGAAGGSLMAAIANQYSTQEATVTKVKVLIMDGGTWDTIQSGGTDASVTSVVNTFTQLLTKVANDGTVEHVIYFLQPELSGIPGVAALRTPMQQACTQSKVPCHFLDLQKLWEGHADYTAISAGIPFPSEAGAVVLAQAIWDIMQSNCIAQ